MKSRLLVPLMSVVLSLAVTSDAFACSESWFANFQIAEFGTPDRLAFLRTSNDAAFEATIVVTASDASEVAGTLELHSEVSLGAEIWVFSPDEPMAAGTYTVALEEQGEVHTQEVVVAEGAALDVAIEAARAEERESTTDIVCCSTVAGGCEDDCGGACTECWAAGYEYPPTITVDLRTNQPLLVSGRVYNEGGDLVMTRSTMFANRAMNTIRLDLIDEHEGELCAEVVAVDLDGLEVLREERCFAPEDIVPIERTAPDFPEAVAQCAEPPDDVSDPNWQRYGTGTGVEDEPGREGARAGESGGCSTAPSAPRLPAGVLGLFAAMILTRRRRRNRG